MLPGLYVTPGLIDLHAHVFAGSEGVGLAGGDTSIFPDAFALRVGVTTVVDAGSSGRRNFAHFKQTVIDRARTRVLAFLNIGGVGMPGDDQEQNVADMDAKAAAELAIANRDTIVGIKVAHYRGPDWTPVERGVEAGTHRQHSRDGRFRRIPSRASVSGAGAEETPPGRHLHACFYAPVPMLDEQGQLLPYLFEARKRGVLFDVGPRRRGLRVSSGGSRGEAGFSARFHFHRRPFRQPQFRHEGPAERHVEVPEHGDVAG